MSTTKKVVGVITVLGAGLLLVNSAIQIASAKSIKQALFPAVGVLVGFAAFNYAMQDINKPELLTTSSED